MKDGLADDFGSMTVDVLGMDSDRLQDAALVVGQIYEQKHVLVFDGNKDKGYFIQTSEMTEAHALNDNG